MDLYTVFYRIKSTRLVFFLSSTKLVISSHEVVNMGNHYSFFGYFKKLESEDQGHSQPKSEHVREDEPRS